MKRDASCQPTTGKGERSELTDSLGFFFPAFSPSIGHHISVPPRQARLGPAERVVHRDQLDGARRRGERVQLAHGSLPAAAARAGGAALTSGHKEEE